MSNHIEIIGKELDHQLDQLGKLFDEHTKSISNLEYMALKGHLLIEYYLNLLLVLKSNPDELKNIEDISFFQKVFKLKDLKLNNLKPWVVDSLFKLNKIRNNLSHSLDYKISETDIDSLGFNLGKKYIHRKLSIEKISNMQNLLWVLRVLVLELYKPIATEIIMESIEKEAKLADRPEK